MADDVNVQFGATVDGAITNINRITHQLEAFGANVQGLTEPLKAFGEAALAAFAVEKIQHFIEGVTDLGVQVERTSQQLGISTEAVGELNSAAKFSDTSLENMRNSMARFDLIAQEAATGTGNGAAAFKTLGISVRDSSGAIKDSQALFAEISEKFKETADNGNKTAIAMALFGRQGKDLIPILNKGAEGMEEMRAVAERTGTLFSEGLVDALHETHDKIVELDLAQTGLKNTLFTALKPAIDLVEQAMVDMAEGFNDALKNSSTLKFAMDALVTVLKGFESGVLLFATAIETSVKTTMASIAALETAFKNGFAAGKQVWDTQMKEILADNQNTWNKIEKLWATDPVTAGKNKKPDIGNLGDALGAEAAINKDIEAHKKMLDEELAMVGENLQARMILQQKYYDWLKTKYPQDANAAADAGRRIAQTQDQEIKKSTASWQHFFGSFNSGLLGMLHGTETWRSALSKTFFSVIEFGLKAIERLVASWIGSELTKTAATNAGNAARLASNVTGAAAGKAAQAAMDSTSVLASAKTGAAAAYSSTAAIPIIGPILAPGAAALAFGAIAAFDSFEVGTPYVPKTGPYILHEGEEVRPANVKNSDSGGGEMHVHISAIDSRDVARFFKNNAGHITDALNTARRNGHKGTHR